MREHILNQLKRSHFIKFIFLFFIVLSIWWFSMFFRNLQEGIENNLFTLIYPILSLIGGIIGLFVAKKWGGIKSYLGASISFFSFGLLAQFFGQATYAYFIYIKGIEIPYPSLGDLGYFGSVIFYLIAVFFLAKVSGIKISLNSFKGKFMIAILPLIMLILSYFFFLKGYEFDWTNKLKIFLDFGYPFGQAIYVSIAILALLLCRNVLGGIMRKPIFFIIFALIFQYFSDFMFLYQANQGTWYVGGMNDYLYFVSYFIMTIGLIYIGGMFDKIKNS